jgi:hypothetical protein
VLYKNISKSTGRDKIIPVKDKCRAVHPAGYVRMALSIAVNSCCK